MFDKPQYNTAYTWPMNVSEVTEYSEMSVPKARMKEIVADCGEPVAITGEAARHRVFKMRAQSDAILAGIGTVLNTGTVIGAGSNLYGAEMPPRYVPPFSWGTGDRLVEYRLDKFLEVAERAMGRRGVELTEGARTQLGRAWERSAPLRGT